MKKVLPINLEPPVRSYSYFSYPHCIISAPERIGEKVAEFTFFEYERYDWNEKTGNIQIKREGERFCAFSGHPYKENLNGCLFRNLKEDDFIRISICFQEYTHPWGAINLFISDLEEEKIMLNDDDYICRLGNFNRDGVYFRCNNIMQNTVAEDIVTDISDRPVELLLHRKGNLVEGYIGDEKGNLRLAYRKELSLSEKMDLKIGVQLKMNDNVYYKWLFSNYIQLSFANAYYAWRMDYFYGVIKEWRFDWVNYFLNSNNISLKYVNKYGSLKFLKENIDNGSYIEAMLDQYYIENREEYQGEHHLHQNLIYGYDDEKKYFLVLGYTNNGLLAQTQISFQDMKRQFEKTKRVKDIYIIEYQQDENPVLYNPSYILNMMGQYLESENSGYYLNMIVYQQHRWVYGMDIYDTWTQGEGLDRVFTDRRITHLLYEHKTLMKERVKYIFYKEGVEGEEVDLIIRGFDEVENLALQLRNLVLKSGISGSEEEKNKILQCIHVLKNREQECLRKFFEIFDTRDLKPEIWEY